MAYRRRLGRKEEHKQGYGALGGAFHTCGGTDRKDLWWKVLLALGAPDSSLLSLS